MPFCLAMSTSWNDKMNYYGGDLYPSRGGSGGGGGGSMKAVFLGVVGLAVYGARWWFYSWIAEARRSKQRMQPLWLADKEVRPPNTYIEFSFSLAQVIYRPSFRIRLSI